MVRFIALSVFDVDFCELSVRWVVCACVVRVVCAGVETPVLAKTEQINWDWCVAIASVLSSALLWD